MFLHNLPTTRSISYADYFHTLKWSAEVSQATEKRSRLQQILASVNEEKSGNVKESSSTEGGVLLSHKEWIKVVQGVDDYLPYLFSIHNSIKADQILLKGELFFTWKDTLSASTSKNLLPGIQYELISVLIVQAKSLCNFAASLVASLGHYELTEAATMSEEERKKKEDRLKFAADLQCRAAGILEYVGMESIPEWENLEGVTRLSHLGRSIESTGEFCFALSKLSQAEAELLAIRKLLSPCHCYQTAHHTSQPPLAASHPSPSLLSKLFLNVTSCYESALSLCQIASSKAGIPIDGPSSAKSQLHEGGGSSSRSLSSVVKSKLTLKSSPAMTPRIDQNNVTGKVSSSFVKYLSKNIRNNRARAYFWLGVDRGERGQYGEALAFLQLASDELDTSTSGSRNTFRRDEKTKEEKKGFARDKEELLRTIETFTLSYKQLNDSVAFQPIPNIASLTSQIPAGRAATAIKAFNPPASIFGVDSVADDLGALDGKDGSDAILAEDVAGGPEYAGKGAYY